MIPQYPPPGYVIDRRVPLYVSMWGVVFIGAVTGMLVLAEGGRRTWLAIVRRPWLVLLAAVIATAAVAFDLATEAR